MGVVFDEVEANIEGAPVPDSASQDGESQESGDIKADQLKHYMADQQRRVERTKAD